MKCQFYTCRKQAQKCKTKADHYLDVMWQNIPDLEKDTEAAPNIGYFILKQPTINWKESS